MRRIKSAWTLSDFLAQSQNSLNQIKTVVEKILNIGDGKAWTETFFRCLR